MSQLKHGLILICLVMLCSCSSKPIVKVVTHTNTVYVLPPADWLELCDSPHFSGFSNLDLLNYSLTQTNALAMCNVNMLRLQQWRQQYQHASLSGVNGALLGITFLVRQYQNQLSDG